MKIGYIYDPIFLEHDTGEHLENKERLEAIVRHLEETGLIKELVLVKPRAAITDELALVHDKRYIKNIKEFAEKGKYFFSFDYQYEEKVAEKHFSSPEAADRLRAYVDRLSGLDGFEKAQIEQALRGLADEMGIKPAVLIHPVRLATTGTSAGPPLFDLLELLGGEEVIKRIKRAVEFIQAKL